MQTKRPAALIAVLVAALALALTACVQMPTEKQGISDLRPQISFSVDTADERAMSSLVFVDGIEVGAASQFRHGVNSLKILPGTHQIKVIGNGETLLEERVYIGDGVNKSFTLK